MIIKKGDKVHFDINEEELIQSIAFLKDLKDFCKSRKEEGAKETMKALAVAIETMMAFYREHFSEETGT